MNRLLRSIDFPVETIIILVGNEDETIVDAITKDIEQIQKECLYLNINILKLNRNPGENII